LSSKHRLAVAIYIELSKIYDFRKSIDAELLSQRLQKEDYGTEKRKLSKGVAENTLWQQGSKALASGILITTCYLSSSYNLV
jgi:hypothetical protein